MGALSQPLARVRALFGGQDAGDFPLQRDLTRHLITLRRNQLLSQGLDLLVVRAIRQVGFELAMQDDDRGGPSREARSSSPIDWICLRCSSARSVIAPERQAVDHRTGPARSSSARPTTLGAGYRESSHGHQHRDNAGEYRLLHVYLPCR